MRLLLIICSLVAATGLMSHRISRHVLVRNLRTILAMVGIWVFQLARYRDNAEPGLVRLHSGTSDLIRDVWLSVHVDMRNMHR
jgi:hypothetical protein